LRFCGTCYRAHHPAWAFKPLSGDGAAVHGGRFNPEGLPALYLALDFSTAILEANQGFAHKIDPCTLCAYEVDCDDIADLRGDAGRKRHSVRLSDMKCAWLGLALAGRTPPSWEIARRLIANGFAGILVPSFALRAPADAHNIVLWNWGSRRPHRVTVSDPGGKLPKNQLSWK
jgi:RES domain-containing protein